MATRLTQHPAYTRKADGYIGGLIHVYSALKADASASRIHALYRKSADRNGPDHHNSVAAWDAFWALKTQAEQSIKEAHHRGLLLLCWHGTNTLKGGAA